MLVASPAASRDGFTTHLLQALGRATEHRYYRPGDYLLHDGAAVEEVFLIKFGWACEHKMLTDGRRQIVNFLLPGDWAGLGVIGHPSAFQHVMATTAVEVAAIECEAFLRFLRDNPKYSAVALSRISQNAAMLCEHMVSVGQRTAYQRVIHLFLELSSRLSTLGLSDRDTFRLPVSQIVLSDALGLSPVHFSRTLRQIRNDGVMLIQSGCVHILDREKAVARSEFDGSYLTFDGGAGWRIDEAISSMPSVTDPYAIHSRRESLIDLEADHNQP